MQHHDMECMEDTPTKNLYEGSEIDVEKKRMHVHQCRYCGKQYVQKTALQNHERNKHEFTVSESGNSNNENAQEDRVYSYTHTLLVLLLLRA